MRFIIFLALFTGCASTQSIPKTLEEWCKEEPSLPACKNLKKNATVAASVPVSRPSTGFAGRPFKSKPNKAEQIKNLKINLYKSTEDLQGFVKENKRLRKQLYNSRFKGNKMWELLRKERLYRKTECGEGLK